MGIKTTQSLGSGSSGTYPGSATRQLCGLRHVPHISLGFSPVRWGPPLSPPPCGCGMMLRAAVWSECSEPGWPSMLH